jgi:hypothetical protein
VNHIYTYSKEREIIMFTTKKNRIEKAIQECISQVGPEIDSYIKPDHAARQAIMNDAYFVGYMEGWTRELLSRQGLKGCHEQASALIGVCRKVLKENQRKISLRLLALYKDDNNSAFQGGRRDGTDRVLGVSNGRQEEVTYLLMHHLQSFSLKTKMQ